MSEGAAYENLQREYAAVINELTLKTVRNEDLEREVDDLRIERDLLRHRLAKLTKHFFSQTTERILTDERQLPLGVDFGSSETPAEVEESSEEVTVPAHTRTGRGRKPLPDNLPREVIVVEPEEKTCSGCERELSTIGVDVTEILERTPAKLLVKEYHRPRCACSSCKNEVVQAPLPVGVQPIDGARVGPTLLSHLIISKYVDHLPLYRQEKIDPSARTP